MTEVLSVPAASADAALDSQPESLSVITPQRQGKALLGWLSEPVVRPIFHIRTVTSPLDVESFVAEARSRRQARTRIPLTPPTPGAVSEPPAALAARVDHLRATDQFKTAYEPFGAMFAMVPLPELVTPQWWADIEYVEALAASAPAEDDLDGMFDFSFSMDRLARPMNLGLNGAAFASARGDSGNVGPLRVARYSPEKVTFEFDHITPTARHEKLADPRIARMLGVPEGTEVMRRLRVTGPETEPPFQINDSWIHPRGVADAPEVANQEPGPGGWLYRLEAVGHGPISWTEYHRARMPAKDEADLLQIPMTLPVLEIVRVGRSAKDNQPIEVTMYVIPSDRVETFQVLHRDESAVWPWPDQPGGEPEI